MERFRAVPWRTLVVCLLLGQAVAVLAFAPGLAVEVSVRNAARVALMGLALGGWAFFGAWSWRWVLRRRATEKGRRIFWWGVVLFGVTSGVAMAVLRTMDAVASAAVLSLPFVRELLIQGFVQFPMMAWGGWLWGSVMMFTLGGLPAPPGAAAES